MSEQAFNLIEGSLVRRRQTATTFGNHKVPTQEEIDKLYSERITPKTDLPPMQPLFRMFGVPCFYRGELTADCGRAKSGKTYFLSILMASALKKQVLAVERLTEEPLKVLWIDTEQSQQSTQEIMKERIMPLAEVGQLDDTQFFAFNLRGLGFETRRRMVDVAVKTIKPDICIIDGINDLMTDINDAVQATNIMEELMALAKDQKCCIVCVLHLNKSMQDWNMRGSIGTELTNKAFEVFQCAIIEDHGVFKVTHSFSRKQKMKRKFYYVVNDQGLPEERSDYQEQPRDDQGRWMSREEATKKNPNVDPDVDLSKLFSDAMEGRRQRPFNELMAVALKKCGVPDAQTYYAYFAMAEEKGIVRKEDHPETHVTWVEFIDNPLPF